MIKRRNSHRRRYQKTGNPIHRLHRNLLNTQIQKRIQHIRNAEWQAKLQGIGSTDHTLWSTYKITGGPRTQIPVLHNISTGDAYFSDQEKAEALVSAFASVHEEASQISSPLEGQVSADIAAHEEEGLNLPPTRTDLNLPSPNNAPHQEVTEPKSSRTR